MFDFAHTIFLKFWVRIQISKQRVPAEPVLWISNWRFEHGRRIRKKFHQIIVKAGEILQK
jgi:hypothetical protein